MSRSNSNSNSNENVESMFGYGMSVESIVTKEIVKLVSSSFCGEGLRTTLVALFGKLWKICVLFGVQYFIKNTKGLSSFLSSLFRLVFYKKMMLNIKDNESVDFLYHKKLENFLSTSNEDVKALSVNGFRIYGQKIDNKIQIEYMNILHSSFIQNQRIEAEEALKEYQNSKEIMVNCIDSKRKPMELYASKNFIRTARIIQEFFKVKKCRNSFSAQAMLIDGIPGLGKTVFLDYAAFYKLAAQFIYMNLTREEYRNLDFGECIAKIYNITITGTCVVHVDEIDKHLDYRIKTKYHNLLYKQGPSPKSPTKDDSKEKEKLEDVPAPIPSFEEFRESEKSNFLYQLTDLIESKHFPFGVVFILTCNNFESIFEGVDMKHFHSLKRRFLKVRFEKCDKEDFVGYCKFYNDSFKEKCPEKYIPDEEFEEIIELINPSLKVPFWIIHQEMIGASFSIRTLIETINNLPENIEEDFYNQVSLKETLPKLYTPPTRCIIPKFGNSSEKVKLASKEEISEEEFHPKKTSKEEECSVCKKICKEEELATCNTCRKIMCFDCGMIYCEYCDGTFCKEHYEECDKCTSHIHGYNEHEEKMCSCCQFCETLALGDACCVCSISICVGCINKKKDCFVCERCEEVFCNKHICELLECEENYHCKSCCPTIKESVNESSHSKYYCKRIDDQTLDSILVGIPDFYTSKNLLGELKEYDFSEKAYKEIEISYIEILERISNCDKPINAIRAFLNLTESTRGASLKIYCTLKLFEYILGEKCDQFIYQHSVKKLRDVVLLKIKEFEENDAINKNMKFITISSEIKKRFARVDKVE